LEKISASKKLKKKTVTFITCNTIQDFTLSQILNTT